MGRGPAGKAITPNPVSAHQKARDTSSLDGSGRCAPGLFRSPRGPGSRNPAPGRPFRSHTPPTEQAGPRDTDRICRPRHRRVIGRTRVSRPPRTHEMAMHRILNDSWPEYAFQPTDRHTTPLEAGPQFRYNTPVGEDLQAGFRTRPPGCRGRRVWQGNQNQCNAGPPGRVLQIPAVSARACLRSADTFGENDGENDGRPILRITTTIRASRALAPLGGDRLIATLQCGRCLMSP